MPPKRSKSPAGPSRSAGHRCIPKRESNSKVSASTVTHSKPAPAARRQARTPDHGPSSPPAGRHRSPSPLGSVRQVLSATFSAPPPAAGASQHSGESFMNGPSPRACVRSPSSPGGARGERAMKLVVLARVRPLPAGCPSTLRVDGDRVTVQDPKTQAIKAEHKFNVTLGPDATNADAYLAAGAPALSAALQGFNGCVFAYGQTGSGKTHTVLGSEGEEGISPRILSELFRRIQVEGESGVGYDVSVAFMEIYNETIRDLFDAMAPPSQHFHRGRGNSTSPAVDRRGASSSPAPGADREAGPATKRVREHPVRGIFVEGLKEVPVSCAADAVRLMTRGVKERATAPTKLNHRSSRSHAIFQVRIGVQNAHKGSQCFTTLNIVDLAGSENVSRAGVTGERLEEAINVNQSLSTLRLVLDKLVERQRGTSDVLVPYRNSVLTRVLQDCLGGSSKTTMVACVSGKEENVEATRNTLTYAVKASQIVCNPKSQEKKTRAVVADLQRQVEQLRQLLQSAQQDGDGYAGRETRAAARNGVGETDGSQEEEMEEKEQALREAILQQQSMMSRAAELEKNVEELTRRREMDAEALRAAERRIEEDQCRLREALEGLGQVTAELQEKQPCQLEQQLTEERDQHQAEVRKLKQELRHVRALSKLRQDAPPQLRRSVSPGGGPRFRDPSTSVPRPLATSPSGRLGGLTSPTCGRSLSKQPSSTRTRIKSTSPSPKLRVAPPPVDAAPVVEPKVVEPKVVDGVVIEIPAQRWRMGDRLMYCDRSGNHVEWMIAGHGRLIVQRTDGAGQSPPINEIRVALNDDGDAVDVDLLPCSWYSPLPIDGVGDLLGKLKSLANASDIRHNVEARIVLSSMPEEFEGFQVGQRVRVTDDVGGQQVGIIESFGKDGGVNVTFGKLRGTFTLGELLHY